MLKFTLNKQYVAIIGCVAFFLTGLFILVDFITQLYCLLIILLLLLCYKRPYVPLVVSLQCVFLLTLVLDKLYLPYQELYGFRSILILTALLISWYSLKVKIFIVSNEVILFLLFGIYLCTISVVISEASFEVIFTKLATFIILNMFLFYLAIVSYENIMTDRFFKYVVGVGIILYIILKLYPVEEFGRISIEDVNNIWLSRGIGLSTLVSLYFLIKKSIVHYFIFPFLLCQIMFVGARGPFISLLLSIVFFLLFLFKGKKYKQITIISFILLILFSVLYFWDAPFRTIDRLLILISDYTFKERIYFIQKSFSLWQSSPMIGIGISGIEKGFPYPHNLFVEILLETGIIGFTIFCLFLFLSYKRIIKSFFIIQEKNKQIKMGLLISASLFGLINSLFSGNMASNQIFFFFLGLALAFSYNETISNENICKEGRKSNENTLYITNTCQRKKWCSTSR